MTAPQHTPPRKDPRREIGPALVRFRVIARIVGIGLVVLVFVGMPLEYLADQKAVVAVVGPAHGFLYIVYLVLTLDLCLRARFGLVKTVALLAAGTIPFLAFVAERRVDQELRPAPSPG